VYVWEREREGGRTTSPPPPYEEYPSPSLLPLTVLLGHIVVFCVLFHVLYTILSSLLIYSYPISPPLHMRSSLHSPHPPVNHAGVGITDHRRIRHWYSRWCWRDECHSHDANGRRALNGTDTLDRPHCDEISAGWRTGHG
jgi:hypothetical protein